MKRTLNVSFRAMLAVAVMFCAMLAIHRVAFAQPPTAFDVKAASAADNNANEYPLAFTINYADLNGLDGGPSQAISLQGDGTQQFEIPAGAGNPVSITWGGIPYPFPADYCQTGWHKCFPPNANGGCWCLCFQWCRIWRWWWIPRFFWYYNPCC